MSFPYGLQQISPPFNKASGVYVVEKRLMEELDSPDVVYKDDGSVWVYYHNQTIEITDKFENGFCFVKVVEGKKTFYMTIKYKDGYGIKSDTYPDPKEF